MSNELVDPKSGFALAENLTRCCMNDELVERLGAACVQELIVELLREAVAVKGARLFDRRVAGAPPVGLTLAEMSESTGLPDNLLMYYLVGMVGVGRVLVNHVAYDEPADAPFLGGELSMKFRQVYSLSEGEMNSDLILADRLRDQAVSAGREIRG